jgi:hypothetical protein
LWQWDKCTYGISDQRWGDDQYDFSRQWVDARTGYGINDGDKINIIFCGGGMDARTV